MIIGTVTALIIIFGGGSGIDVKQIKENIRSVITDQARAEQVETVIDDFANLVAAYDNELKVVGKQVSDLNLSYQSTTAQYDALLDEGMKATVAARERLLDLRFKAKDLMTKEEWQALFAAGAAEETSD